MATYNVVDTFWVAGLAQARQAIAGLTVVFPLQAIAGALGIGAGVGVASLVARRLGERRLAEANAIGGNAVTFPILSGGALACLALFTPHTLLHLFGAQADILPAALAYVTTVAFGFPFLLFVMTVNGLYQGSGNTLMPMVVMTTSAGINLVLDPLLIYGVGPFPRLEVRGAALATVISQMAGFLISAAYLRSGRSGYHIHARDLAPRLTIVRDVAQVGAPAAVMHVVMSVVVSVFNTVLGGFGSVAIAAYGLTFRVTMVVMPFVFGAGQGLLPIVGYSFGAREYRRMWHAIWIASLWASLVGFVLGGFLLLFAPSVIALFTRDAELHRLTVLAVRLMLLTLWLAAPQMMAVSALQGMGLGMRAMVLALARQLLFLIPALLLLSSFFGITGAFAAQPTADLLAFLLTAFTLLRLHQRYRPLDSAARVSHNPANGAAG